MSEHVHSTRLYYTVFVTLLALTALTVAAATMDLGRVNAVIALTIAVSKGTLVVLFFMHLRDSARLTWLAVAVAIAWLLVLIGFTMSDLLTRGWMGQVGA